MILYRNIARAVALRAKQLIGGSAAEREAAYTAASVTANMDGVEVPYSALKQDILATEAELVSLIAASSNPLFRRELWARSASVASGAQVPHTSSTGLPFIGALESFTDVTTGQPLTEAPLQVVRRRNANAGTFFLADDYHFCVHGTLLFHTRSGGVYANGCVWDRAKQAALLDRISTSYATGSFGPSDVTPASDIITIPAHGYYTGQRVRVNPASGSPPAPLLENQDYYVINAGTDDIQLADTYADALAGNAVDITTTGSIDGGDVEPQGEASPLPQELEVLWTCMVLQGLSHEDWFVENALVYANIVAAKQAALIDGKVQLMTMPTMPVTSSRVDPVKD